MHLTVLAVDLDGTIAEHGQVAAETWAALREARDAGMTLLLATGRTMISLESVGPIREMFDVVVAEDGAVVYFSRYDAFHLPFGNLPVALLDRINQLQLPIEQGMVLLATHVPHDGPIHEILRECGGGATVEYNRGEVMVLPVGATKGSGVLFALHELGLSAHNLVACGDAENDRSLLKCAELAVAVENAHAEIKALADLVLEMPNGAGVRGLLQQLIHADRLARRPRQEQWIPLGIGPTGEAVGVDSWSLIDDSWGITGDSGSGKSWLSGMLAEAVIQQGYQAVIIDPEGDYRNLASLPHTMIVGGQETHLRRVGDIATLCEYANWNLVVDLSSMPTHLRSDFCERLLHALLEIRRKRGRPHWLLIDEVQQFCFSQQVEFTRLLKDLMELGGTTLVTYRPSNLPESVLKAIDTWVHTHTSATEELAALDQLLTERPGWEVGGEHLQHLAQGVAWMIRMIQPAQAGVSFHIRHRQLTHIRHLHKYARVAIPTERWFYFRGPNGKSYGSAANLLEFRTVLERIPVESLRFHLERGDFAKWASVVLQDEELARQLRKLAGRQRVGERLRSDLAALMSRRIDELTLLH